MYRRILIATDGSPLSRKAIDEGVALARSVGASVVGFHARAPVMLPSWSTCTRLKPFSRKARVGAFAAGARDGSSSVCKSLIE